MYLGQTDLDSEICSNNLDEAIMAIGISDAFKCSAICRLLKKLSPEPSEIIVLSTNAVHKGFYDQAGIPIANNLDQIAQILREVIEELQYRQKLFRFKGEIKHRINIVVELDDLHDALRERAIKVGFEYSERELDGAIGMLQEDGSKVGMFIVASITKPGVEIGCRIYSGTEAIKYVLDETTRVSEDVYQRITQRLEGQTHPCCLVVGKTETVYPIEGITDRFVPLEIRLIPEVERVIKL